MERTVYTHLISIYQTKHKICKNIPTARGRRFGKNIGKEKEEVGQLITKTCFGNLKLVFIHPTQEASNYIADRGTRLRRLP